MVFCKICENELCLQDYHNHLFECIKITDSLNPFNRRVFYLFDALYNNFGYKGVITYLNSPIGQEDPALQLDKKIRHSNWDGLRTL